MGLSNLKYPTGFQTGRVIPFILPWTRNTQIFEEWGGANYNWCGDPAEHIINNLIEAISSSLLLLRRKLYEYVNANTTTNSSLLLSYTF